MYATIKEKVGMLILVMLLICGAVNAQHWRHYCYYPSNRVVTVVVKPDMLHYISNRFNRKERLAKASSSASAAALLSCVILAYCLIDRNCVSYIS